MNPESSSQPFREVTRPTKSPRPPIRWSLHPRREHLSSMQGPLRTCPHPLPHPLPRHQSQPRVTTLKGLRHPSMSEGENLEGCAVAHPQWVLVVPCHPGLDALLTCEASRTIYPRSMSTWSSWARNGLPCPCSSIGSSMASMGGPHPRRWTTFGTMS